MVVASQQKVCVFGSGAFGTALGAVVARNGYPVTMLTRRPEVAESINTKHVNPQSMPDMKLPPLLAATTSKEEALAGVTFIVHSIPVQSTENFLNSVKDLIGRDVPIISSSKGLHSDTLETMADLVPRVLGRPQPMGFLSGPTFARELMEAFPSGAVMAAENMALAERCAALFMCPALRVYTTTDVIGVEIGGALKNVYAICAGAIEGMGLGVNTTAFLVTRACAEMNMMAVALGAKAHTMAGLAGIGDLMLTCMGGASRNKAVGLRIGKGESLAAILEERKATGGEVAEGVATTPAAARLAKKLGVDAKIINAVSTVFEGKHNPQQVGMLLMTATAPGQDFAAAAHVQERQLRRRIGGFFISRPVLMAVAAGEFLALACLAGALLRRQRRA